jgi:hypothetical protein
MKVQFEIKKMLRAIKNFFMNKYNLVLILILALISAYSLFIGRKQSEVLFFFQLAFLYLIFGIHPFINKKDMYMGAYKYPFKGGEKYDFWFRVAGFVLGVCMYFGSLYKIVNP